MGGSRRSVCFPSLQSVQTETVCVLGGVSASFESVTFLLMGGLASLFRETPVSRSEERNPVANFMELASDRGL
jgi:hypothetical protein